MCDTIVSDRTTDIEETPGQGYFGPLVLRLEVGLHCSDLGHRCRREVPFPDFRPRIPLFTGITLPPLLLR